MPRRPVLAALVASLALVAGAAACGPGGGPTGPAAAQPPRVGTVDVDPASGPLGTMFTLTAQGLKEGEAVAFEITFPGEGKAYPGAALTVPADGTASTTYRATTANEPGVYIVRLTGPPGNLAEGRFTVSDGPAITSTLPDTTPSSSGPSTSWRSATTSRLGRTTSSLRAGSSTSKASSTTATTQRGTGSSSTVKKTT